MYKYTIVTDVMPAVHIQICVQMCMYPRCVCKVCTGALVRVSSEGNTIYMNLYKNGCWNNKICRKTKFLTFKFLENLIKTKKKEKKKEMIIGRTESKTFKIMHTLLQNII